MLLVPTDIYEKLEFNKVKELLKQQCLGDLGIQKIEKIQLHLQSFIIERLLREVEEYSYQEIAEVTGFTVDKVKVSLHRARITLRERLESIYIS